MNFSRIFLVFFSTSRIILVNFSRFLSSNQVLSKSKIFIFQSQITVGDVVCFRMPLTCGEDPIKAWSVNDPQLLTFHDEIAVGVACHKLGTVLVSYQSRKKLTTALEILPIDSVSLQFYFSNLHF